MRFIKRFWPLIVLAAVGAYYAFPYVFIVTYCMLGGRCDF